MPPLLPITLLLASQILLAQTPVFLENPSFEDLPQYASVPGGWRSCAFNGESPPDIHPVENGRFGVSQTPTDGETYLGLVVRENGTAESVGQHLSEPLRTGQCYSFSLQLCRSDTFVSMGRVSFQTVNFDTPVSLRIWGGHSPCGKKTLLAASSPVGNTEWEKFTFRIQPEEDVEWLMLEASFTGNEDYNGNLLLDGASPLVPIDCTTEAPLVDVSEFQTPQFLYRKIVVHAPNPEGFFSYQGNGHYIVNLRLAQSEEILAALLAQNCERIGFRRNTAELNEPLGIGLKEIGVNAEKFSRRLVIGMEGTDARQTKKRSRKVAKLMREINLTEENYRIEILAPPYPDGWDCEGGGIKLKWE